MNTKGLLSFAMLAVLAGCQSGPIDVLYKEGSTRAERQQAYDQCFIQALREVPQNMVTEVSGGYSVPGFIDCNTDGNTTVCGEVGGYTTPVSSYSYDTNEKLRNRVINRCLTDKGFSTIERPICESRDERTAYALLPTQPNAAQIACVSGQSFDPN
ncbi:hypothetical protein FF124_19720 [Martelella lutilitoris]|uniref:Lipoprotein n=1 Tax=Martelella lutilitoris TaxID=2583532 RepID=A0A5C4JKV2_9HYPH|nr:hypothetical protein [Martelella lutilitoris]TNB46135.1 hypothetical protein FF124_19720 [Martelella lutilitoris]